MWHRPKEELLTYLKERNVPDHIQADFPQFLEFLNSFYEYIDIEGNGGEVISELIQYRSIDHTVEELADYFTNEFTKGLPKATAVAKGRIIKNAKDYYKSKGTDKALRYLFKAIFAEDISIYYPKNDMLVVSGSRWVEPDVMYVGFTDPSDPDVFDYETREVWKDFVKSLNGVRITGEISGASAQVVRAEFIDDYYYNDSLFNTNSPKFYVRLSIEDINGDFDLRNSGDDEFEFFQVGDYLGVIYKSLTSIEITDSGVGYRIGDTFDATVTVSPPNGDSIVYTVDNFVTVRKLQQVSIDTNDITVVNPGIGYEGDFKQVDNWLGLPIEHAFSDSNFNYRGLINLLSDFVTEVPFETIDDNTITSDAVSTTSDSDFGFTGTVSPLDTISTFVLGEGDTFSIVDQLGSGRPGIGKIVEVTSNGQIVSLAVLRNGIDIQLPRLIINSETGEGAEFLIEARGPIGAVDITNPIIVPRFATIEVNYDTEVILDVSKITIINGGSGFVGDETVHTSWLTKPIELAFAYNGSPWDIDSPLTVVATHDPVTLTDDTNVTADSISVDASSAIVFEGTATPSDIILAIDSSPTAETFMITDNAGFGTAALGFISKVDPDGTILELTVTTPGVNIVDPVMTITTASGINEEIIVDAIGRFGARFDLFYTSVGTGGKYYDAGNIRGHISDKNKIQDSFYYQDFSYDVKSSKSFSNYKKTLNELFHPVGQKQFGSVDYAKLVDARAEPVMTLEEFA